MIVNELPFRLCLIYLIFLNIKGNGMIHQKRFSEHSIFNESSIVKKLQDFEIMETSTQINDSIFGQSNNTVGQLKQNEKTTTIILQTNNEYVTTRKTREYETTYELMISTSEDPKTKTKNPTTDAIPQEVNSTSENRNLMTYYTTTDTFPGWINTENLSSIDSTISPLLTNTTRYFNISNANGSSPRKQFVVVDFRQWYQYGFEIILYGYFMPIWAVLNWILYALMITVLIKGGITSKTQICIIAMAICDGLCPICPCIMYLYVFAIRQHIYFLPFDWCRNFYYFTEVIPQIFSSISNLLTVMLAIQRYIIVAFPFKVGKLVSKGRTFIGIFTCMCFAVATRIIYFLHYDFFAISVPAFNYPNETMNACAVQAPDWIGMPFFKYLGIVQLINTIVHFLIPFILLITAQMLLVFAIFRNKQRRKSLTLGNKNNEKREQLLTRLTIAITGIQITFLGCSLVVFTIDLLHFFFNISVIKQNDLRSVVAILNAIFWLCIVPSNFVLTCCLSKEFRKGLKQLICAQRNSKETPETT